MTPIYKTPLLRRSTHPYGWYTDATDTWGFCEDALHTLFDFPQKAAVIWFQAHEEAGPGLVELSYKRRLIRPSYVTVKRAPVVLLTWTKEAIIARLPHAGPWFIELHLA